MADKIPLPAPEVIEVKEIKVRSDVEIMADETVIAMPLTPPDTFNVQLLVPGIRVRWINYRTHQGIRLDNALTSGFVFATDKDCKTVVPMKDGRIATGDLVLMKIESARYEGALKANALKARLATGQKLRAASQEILDTARGVLGQKQQHLLPYAPTDKEVEASIGGRVKITTTP